MFLKALIPISLLFLISVSGLQTPFGRTNQDFLGPLESHISFSNQPNFQFLEFSSNNQACSCQNALKDGNLYEIDRCQCLSNPLPVFNQLGTKKGDFEDVIPTASIFLSQKFAQKQLDKDLNLEESLLSTKEQSTEISPGQGAVNFAGTGHPSRKSKYSSLN